QRTIMSRIISPEMPAVVATQEIASRSWQSRAKATRTTSPFQAGKLERIRAPAAIRADRYHLAIVRARPPSPGVALEQETVLLHQPVDALGVDRGQTVGSPLALAAILRYP